KEVTGANRVAITGTYRYPTAGGASKTVYVLEPKPKTKEEIDKEEAEAIEKAQREEAEAAAREEQKRQEAAARERMKRAEEAQRLKEQQAKETQLRRAHLRYAKELLDTYGEDGPTKRTKGAERLAWIVKEYPGSDEAKEAAKLLEQIKKDGGP